MQIRIDSVAGDAPVRLLRVESIQSRRRDPSEEREERREERAASYTPAREEVEVEVAAYAPPARPLIALAPPPAAEAPDPAPEDESALYPSGTPAWITALLKAR